MNYLSFIFGCALAAVHLQNAWSSEGTVKVFILAGQSNMEGKATNALLERQASNSRFKEFWAPYRAGDRWAVRDDVFISFLDRRGPLTIGFGSPDRTGPELAFGWALGDHYTEPVLLIKAAWGGHSLFKNFRPPSAGLPSDAVLAKELENAQKNAEKRKEQPPTMEQIKEKYGASYRAVLSEVKQTLTDLDARFPALRGKRPELAGLFWFQGFNDQFGDDAPAAYEKNMRLFIEDLRKDLAAPKLPVVIAGIGTYAADGQTEPPSGSPMAKVLAGQLAMNGVLEFAGTVKAFPTAPLCDADAAAIYPNWRKDMDAWNQVGSDFGYHYMGSGIWYSRIGRKAGDIMISLQAR